MSLSISPGAFHGSCMIFDMFRTLVCDGMKGSWPKGLENGTWYWGDGFYPETHPGLKILLCHSDCSGEIQPSDARCLGNELEALMPAMLEALPGQPWSHEVKGWFPVIIQRFIDGCRRAWETNEPMIFS